MSKAVLLQTHSISRMIYFLPFLATDQTNDKSLPSELQIVFIFSLCVLSQPEDNGREHERNVLGNVCVAVVLVL